MSRYQLQSPTLADYDFLKNVHHVTLKEHVTKIWGWSDDKQDAFFKEDFQSGQIQIILAANQPVGYLQLNQQDDVIQIVNILILPSFQNRKIGSKIINDLIAKSKKEKHIIELGVFKVNTRAKKLYEMLGFETTGETETHFVMRLNP
jgi:ribosomal protein S18 acetylase RimI-like enzyme